MKTATVLFYFFGSILIPIGLLLFGFFFAPPEFVLDREAVMIEHGVLIWTTFPARTIRDCRKKPGQKGIVHRGIKPGNVFLTNDGQAIY